MKGDRTTDRLVLRQWRESDLARWVEMSADAEVMEFFPGVMSREESLEMAARIRKVIETRGWGLWAVEKQEDQRFIGFVGLQPVRERMPFGSAVEVGWRLARDAWGQGYASEAAKECLRFGFEELELGEVVSFTSVLNWRSIAVMERIGLARRGEFEHPYLPEGHRLRRHVLYEIRAEDWGG